MLNISKLPRKLNDFELNAIFELLPKQKPNYNEARNIIKDKFLIGTSRFGVGNYILADKNDQVDLTAPASNVFAYGIVETDKTEYDITIHDLFEDQIEIDFNSALNEEISSEEKIISTRTISNWQPLKPSPLSQKEVREIHLIKNEIVIAVSSRDKKIWVYERESGYNFIVPVTNFYNEIIRVKEERNPEISLKPKLIFEKPELFSDEEIGQGFLLYNKFMKKMNIDYSIFTNVKKENKKKSFFDKIFGRN